MPERLLSQLAHEYTGQVVWPHNFPKRCKRIWEISRRLGIWEIEEAHDADFVGLTMESVQLTAAPI